MVISNFHGHGTISGVLDKSHFSERLLSSPITGEIAVNRGTNVAVDRKSAIEESFVQQKGNVNRKDGVIRLTRNAAGHKQLWKSAHFDCDDQKEKRKGGTGNGWQQSLKLRLF